MYTCLDHLLHTEPQLKQPVCVCVCVCIHACMHAQSDIHIHTCVSKHSTTCLSLQEIPCIHTYTHTNIHIRIHIHTCEHAHSTTCLPVQVVTYIHIYTHTVTSMYAHTYLGICPLDHVFILPIYLKSFPQMMHRFTYAHLKSCISDSHVGPRRSGVH